jgi:hypothetical protein
MRSKTVTKRSLNYRPCLASPELWQPFCGLRLMAFLINNRDHPVLTCCNRNCSGRKKVYPLLWVWSAGDLDVLARIFPEFIRISGFTGIGLLNILAGNRTGFMWLELLTINVYINVKIYIFN